MNSAVEERGLKLSRGRVRGGGCAALAAKGGGYRAILIAWVVAERRGRYC